MELLVEVVEVVLRMDRVFGRALSVGVEEAAGCSLVQEQERNHRVKFGAAVVVEDGVAMVGVERG